MKNQLFIKSLQLWVLFIPVAIINGSVRNFVYQPVLGDLAAHQVSTALAIALFIGLAYWLLGTSAQESTTKTLVASGFGLLTATILFEFGFGHYVVCHTWSKLLADYNLLDGKVWLLFLLTQLLTPLLVKQLKNRSMKVT